MAGKTEQEQAEVDMYGFYLLFYIFSLKAYAYTIIVLIFACLNINLF